MLKRNISFLSVVLLWGLVGYLFGAQTAAAQASPLYAQCQGCHQPTGAGIPGVFPPLAGHVPEILAAKGGREYLIQVLLYGLQGQITVKGAKYQGAMPAYTQLKDEEIAGLLNHISTQWGNKFPTGQQAFTAAEVKAQRAKTMTAAQVLEARNKLGLK
ncbi:cytochrome c-552 [Meiothermus hypogaeus NBRC 106114]|uniref:Cytochrome c-552 n=2 Tax=Meiothermus hypogaeus TaxID=884155 RepID=A0A511QX86_9DEIN|nr:Cytochrome c-552 [Meiothermus hypogaeus]GEM81998.1 cytochrome c-552 [Meiothermus hypogaeus NBRC 106114]